MSPDNKFKLYKDLSEWIDIGAGVPDMIYDSPFQHPHYAPYVVTALMKEIPKRMIPAFVLDELAKELGIIAEPVRRPVSIWRRILR